MTQPVRYQVFVSSTYTDLMEERQAVISALLQLGAMPAGMELFPAADDEAWSLITRVIDESDYYLLVIGGRYGSLDATGLGFTEKEYEYAILSKKPVMAFLHQSPGKLPFDSSEADPDVREKLEAFRTKVQGAKHVKYWSSAEDLAGKVALSFASFTSTYPAVGWIRANSGDSPETLRKLTEAQDTIDELRAKQSVAATTAPEGAAFLADGDDQFMVEATAHIKILNFAEKAKFSRTQSLEVEIPASWNEILSALGPLMFDEASQNSLQGRFREFIAKTGEETAANQSASWLKRDTAATDYQGYIQGKRRPEPDIEVVKIECAAREFETALVQLQALGLIEKGPRKRTVSDRNTYWALTPWGRTRLTRLRGIPSGSTRPPEEL